jgi:hypothetical protein
VRDLAAACAELTEQLKVFSVHDATGDWADAGLPTHSVLIVDQDAVPGNGRRPAPTTRTPGNTQAINAQMDAHELVRRLEASLRLSITGHTGRRRGGSDKQTFAAIRSIDRLGEAISPHARSLAARLIDRAATVIGQLPAVDEIPRWTKIRSGPGGLPPKCLNCGTFSLRYEPTGGRICCVMPGCRDLDGRMPPQGRLELSKIDGSPTLVWHDGTVQYSPPPEG